MNLAIEREDGTSGYPGQSAWLTSLFQLDDGRAWSKAVPGSAVVVSLEVSLHDITDGESGQYAAA